MRGIFLRHEGKKKEKEEMQGSGIGTAGKRELRKESGGNRRQGTGLEALCGEEDRGSGPEALAGPEYMEESHEAPTLTCVSSFIQQLYIHAVRDPQKSRFESEGSFPDVGMEASEVR